VVEELIGPVSSNFPGVGVFMKFMIRKALSCFCLLLLTTTVAFAQKGKQPAPPAAPPPPDVIAKVTAAKNIFISNASADPPFTQLVPGGADMGYNAFYASLKQWGHFQLVSSPAQADLIFEIRSSTTISGYRTYCGPPNTTYNVYAPALMLSIFEASTHDPVYWITQPFEPGRNNAKTKIAFAQAISELTDQVKTLVASPVTPQTP
jgi:hypothetical protein